MRARTVFAGLLIAGSATLPAAAFELAFEGPLVQGGLVIGRIEPGSTVAVDGRPVRISPRGTFLVGFGRDAPPRTRVRATLPDGSAAVHTLDVERRHYEVQRIDGLPTRQVTPGPEEMKRIRAEASLIGAARTRNTAARGFEAGFAWPVVGRISGVFGSQRILNGEPRRPHVGVDVSADRGTPVVAAADGVVSLAHEDMFFNGKTLMIDHGHGLASIYTHLSAILVEEGGAVARGQPVGRVGATGRATGPHLHWGVSLFATHLDPALLAGPMPTADHGKTY